MVLEIMPEPTPVTLIKKTGYQETCFISDKDLLMTDPPTRQSLSGLQEPLEAPHLLGEYPPKHC
ncbi:hypothetical protein [Acetobacter senegalensis]